MTYEVSQAGLLFLGTAMGLVGFAIGVVVTLSLVAKRLPPPRSRRR